MISRGPVNQIRRKVDSLKVSFNPQAFRSVNEHFWATASLFGLYYSAGGGGGRGDIVCLSRLTSTFPRNTLPPSSRLKNRTQVVGELSYIWRNIRCHGKVQWHIRKFLSPSKAATRGHAVILTVYVEPGIRFPDRPRGICFGQSKHRKRFPSKYFSNNLAILFPITQQFRRQSDNICRANDLRCCHWIMITTGRVPTKETVVTLKPTTTLILHM